MSELIGGEYLAMASMNRGSVAAGREVLFFTGAVPTSLDTMPFDQNDLSSMFQSDLLACSAHYTSTITSGAKHVNTVLTAGVRTSGLYGMQSNYTGIYCQRADRVYLGRALAVYNDPNSATIGLRSKNPIVESLFATRPITASAVQTLQQALASLTSQSFFVGMSTAPFLLHSINHLKYTTYKPYTVVMEYENAQTLNMIRLHKSQSVNIGITVHAFNEATSEWESSGRLATSPSSNWVGNLTFVERTAKLWRVEIDNNESINIGTIMGLVLGHSSDVNPAREWSRGQATWGLVFPDCSGAANAKIAPADLGAGRIPVQLITSDRDFDPFDPTESTVPAAISTRLRYR